MAKVLNTKENKDNLKQLNEETLILEEIIKRYSPDQELAIQRKFNMINIMPEKFTEEYRDKVRKEFIDYYNYIEKCKKKVRGDK